ncbi:hypothetical protein OOT46_20415 [Aquabacterium sp. A7-Y]|uniref:hypothetical protein n=1 Tax=Aquabacterium sp. A7-Y TaxID=1349605 RepID=UPI00223E20F7|nr:hypothetical protein [Aquabacterium sp. A7-Y]MCW7540201.1 hypothetical protein [Aquabacterium sp. A7-Y]
MSCAQQACGPAPARPPTWRAWLPRAALAFFVLNAVLTFENLWPTAGIRFGQRLSFELCLGTLVLMAWVAWRGRAGRRTVALLAAAYTVGVLLRYLDVTVPTLFGRPVNLYWDGQHAWQVARLAASGVPGWQVAAAAAGAAGVLVALYAVIHWATGVLAASLEWQRPRPWLLAAGLALSASHAVYPYVDSNTRWFFSLPVTPALLRQAELLPDALLPHRADQRLSPSPSFERDLQALQGVDVLLVFAESYGVVTLDDTALSEALQPSRQQLLRALQASGREVVSARVRSPTFGGSSWLAHAALLSGVDTRRPGDHDLLLTTKRPTLVSHFARHGWRTVAWMPGLQRPWPEGAFYGFERYADADRIGYQGPAFGYWRIPDQASLALLHAQELVPGADTSTTAGPRRPRFVVFPTLNTHTPFRPLPPYHADWQGLLGRDAYSAAEVAQAEAEPVSWLQPMPAYERSVRYTYEWLSGYLGGQAPRRLLMIVIGDHQPLAAVSGRQAAWDVPVHIIGSDPGLMARLRAAGFTPGLTPSRPALGAMHQLTDLLLDVFDGGAAAPGRRQSSLSSRAWISPEGAPAGSAASH